MRITKQIPNFITLGNLFCGTMATIFAVEEEFLMAGIFVVVGIVFDFFDGFVARLLGVSGELGKQLDSLADMVTSGVVPGVIMLKLIQNNLEQNSDYLEGNQQIFNIALVGLILTLAACFRLAKFNIDTRQTESFIGLPTPAMSLFVISLPLIMEYNNIYFINSLLENNYFLITIICVLSFLMNAEIPLFSLKFKEYSIKNNGIKYLLIISSLLLILTLHFLAIPFVIILYLCLSIIQNLNFKKKSK